MAHSVSPFPPASILTGNSYCWPEPSCTITIFLYCTFFGAPKPPKESARITCRACRVSPARNKVRSRTLCATISPLPCQPGRLNRHDCRPSSQPGSTRPRSCPERAITAWLPMQSPQDENSGGLLIRAIPLVSVLPRQTTVRPLHS